jgi:hypothetical protein
MCSLAPVSKSQISDLDDIEQENIEDIPHKGGGLILLALGEETDDEGSKFTC